MIRPFHTIPGLRFARTLSPLAPAALAAGLLPLSAAAVTVDFSDLSLPGQSYYNGGPATNTLGWTSGGVRFGNDYNASWGGFWNGFAYSTVNAPSTPGFGNQYAAASGTGAGGAGIYAVAYDGTSTWFELPAGFAPASVLVTNTAYTALDLRDGSAFSKKFGGASGTDPDWLDVTFTGYAGPAGSGPTTGSATLRLADFTSPVSELDYILTGWTALDLTPLGAPASIRLTWASTDVGPFGLNTPAYAALDDLVLVPIPEPSAAPAFAGFAALCLVAARRRALRS